MDKSECQILYVKGTLGIRHVRSKHAAIRRGTVFILRRQLLSVYHIRYAYHKHTQAIRLIRYSDARGTLLIRYIRTLSIRYS